MEASEVLVHEEVVKEIARQQKSVSNADLSKIVIMHDCCNDLTKMEELPCMLLSFKKAWTRSSYFSAGPRCLCRDDSGIGRPASTLWLLRVSASHASIRSNPP